MTTPEGTTAYPLTWPVGRPRTPAHKRREAKFRVEFTRSRGELLHSLELLGARDAIISSGLPLRLDGLPLANAREPADPGVAVYFERRVPAPVSAEWRPFVIACDTYTKAHHNLRAIGATVEHLRGIQHHGASGLLEQAFSGFAALPSAPTARPWWEVLEVPKDANRDAIAAAYRKLALVRHPDHGGTVEQFRELTDARIGAHLAIGAKP